MVGEKITIQIKLGYNNLVREYRHTADTDYGDIVNSMIDTLEDLNKDEF